MFLFVVIVTTTDDDKDNDDDDDDDDKDGDDKDDKDDDEDDKDDKDDDEDDDAQVAHHLLHRAREVLVEGSTTVPAVARTRKKGTRENRPSSGPTAQGSTFHIDFLLCMHRA